MNETSSAMEIGDGSIMTSWFNSTTVRPKGDFNSRLFGFKDNGITGIMRFGLVVILVCYTNILWFLILTPSKKCCIKLANNT